MQLVHEAHKHVSRQVLGQQYQSKDNIKVKTEYTLFMYSKAVRKFSRGHATCVQFIFLIIGLA